MTWSVPLACCVPCDLPSGCWSAALASYKDPAGLGQVPWGTECLLACSLGRPRPAEELWNLGVGRPERGLLIRGILLPLDAVLKVTSEGTGNKSTVVWPADLLWQKFCIYEKHVAARPAARRDVFKAFPQADPTNPPTSQQASFVCPKLIVFICSK